MENNFKDLPTFEEFKYIQETRKESDDFLKETGAKVVESTEGEDHLILQPEQISSARQEMEEDTEEDRKYDYLWNGTLEYYLQDTSRLMRALDKKLPDIDLTQVNLWQNMREELAISYQAKTTELIDKIEEGYETNSLPYKLAQDLKQDIYLGIQKTLAMRIPEIIEQKGGVLTDKDLSEIEVSLYLASLNAQYNLQRLGDERHINTIISRQIDLIALNKDFNHKKAGFDEIYEGVQNAYASLSLDLNAKPHYCIPNNVYYQKTIKYHQILQNLSRVEAEYILREYQVDVIDTLH